MAQWERVAQRVLALSCVVSSLLLAGLVGPRSTALADPQPGGLNCQGYLGTKTCAGSGHGGFGVGVGKGGGHGGKGGAGGSGQAYEYAFVLTCPVNSPDGLNLPCGSAVNSCGVQGTLRYWLYRRPVDVAGKPTGPWVQIPGAFCRGPSTGMTLQDIMAAFRWKFVPIAPSATRFNPANGTLVNIDTIFYADTPGTVHTPVTLLGQRVDLTLHPTSWHWTFGDGATMTTDTPGAPYPNTSVTHRYRDTGTYAASVTVTWDGTFTFAGQTADIPGDTSRSGPTSGVIVREAHAHLVGGDA